MSLYDEIVEWFTNAEPSTPEDMAADFELILLQRFAKFYKIVIDPLPDDVKNMIWQNIPLPEREAAKSLGNDEVIDVLYEALLMVFRGCMEDE